MKTLKNIALASGLSAVTMKLSFTMFNIDVGLQLAAYVIAFFAYYPMACSFSNRKEGTPTLPYLVGLVAITTAPVWFPAALLISWACILLTYILITGIFA